MANMMDGVDSNESPNVRELLLQKAEISFENGENAHCVFFQVYAMFQAFRERFFQITLMDAGSQEVKPLLKYSQEDLKENALLQYAVNYLEQHHKGAESANENPFISCDFLRNVKDPELGAKKIIELCMELPKEWTVIQICKSSGSHTTFESFEQMMESYAPVYLTLLRHARSEKYPQPVVLRFANKDKLKPLLKRFAIIPKQFKGIININPKEHKSSEDKRRYWDALAEIDKSLNLTLEDFQNLMFPWNFLFTGYPNVLAKSKTRKSFDYSLIDAFCDKYQWNTDKRVLLSLAALHIEQINEFTIRAVCSYLINNERQQLEAVVLLQKIQDTYTGGCCATNDKSEATDQQLSTHYPCILIVDQKLDHIYWEELNVNQEFCRADSLQSLWRLYETYKPRIKNGYLSMHIQEGGAVIDPDGNLPQSRKRLTSFFKYWVPHWQMKVGERPTNELLIETFSKWPCYVYCGHGSGLQYMNGKRLAKLKADCVVFLFGCDSTRLLSNGLYGELVGSHLYYHAAMCPTIVGTLLPGLDLKMDSILAEMMSRWISPKTPKKTLPWHDVNPSIWSKQGLIKPKSDDPKEQARLVHVDLINNYNIGSLCAILARIHQRKTDGKFYNTVSYVCRGLPAWNCSVQPLPKAMPQI